MTDSIETLLNKHSEQWTLEELKSGFAAALHKLGQANDCIAEQDRLVHTLRDLLSQSKSNNQALMAAFVALQSSQSPGKSLKQDATKRKAGRPAKESKADLSWVCDWYLEAREKYGYEISDTELIKKYFRDLFDANGMRSGRISSIQSKLNTFRTEYVSPAKGILQAKGLLRK